MSHYILVVNPGSTSTKIGVFEGETLLFDKTLRHTAAEIGAFASIPEQKKWRRGLVLDALAEKGFDAHTLSAVCGRGGMLAPVSGGTYPFRYNWNTAAETQDLTALCAGEYAVTVTDMRNCQATLALTLADSSHFPSPIEAWSDQDTLYAGQQTTFHATDLGAGFSYLWTPGEGIADPTAPNTDAIVSTVSDYVVHVIDDAGCELTDTIHLLLHEVICDEPYVFVPNAFTPNGDGKNDRLFVRSDIVLELQFRVYDRWGEKVFETNSLDEGWDGTFRGQPCEQGVYDYYLKVVCLGQVEFFKKGNVTLIR